MSHESAAAQILGAIKSANAGARTPQRDKYVEGVLKQMSAGNFKAIAHLVAVGFNLIDRNAPLALVEEPGHRFVALMRSRWEARACVPVASRETLGPLMLAERLAHAEREARLAVFLDDRGYHHAMQLLDAATTYERHNNTLVDFIRRKAVEAEGPRLAVARAD